MVLLALGGPGWPALAAEEIVVVAFGDSLTAGYGLDSPDVYPVRLEQALRGRGLAARVINAGVSGDTTTGGLARLDWSLTGNPDLVIVQLGGNDALRGIEPSLTRRNLDAILAKIAARGIAVLLAGMYAPPNMGDAFAREFNAIYPELAKRHGVHLYPFFLEGVAAKPALNQDDGIHPNRRGVEEIIARFAPVVAQTLRKLGKSG
ncbi:MAG: arylesterase [Proteobacteria bacterium]|nr:arylesterase [Pseudomonadota bacterium]